MAKIDDFRQAFGKMAPQAIISRSELACLLNTTDGAISQMAYRGELPKTAFPSKRRACWFVADIRLWLNQLTEGVTSDISPTSTDEPVRKLGRPRHLVGSSA